MERVHRVGRALARDFEIGYEHPIEFSRGALCHFQPVELVRFALFVRRIARGQQHYAVQTELRANAARNFDMTVMNGIKRPAHDADSHNRPPPFDDVRRVASIIHNFAGDCKRVE